MLPVTKNNNNNTSPWNFDILMKNFTLQHYTTAYQKPKVSLAFKENANEIIINGFYCFFFLSCNNRIILLYNKKYLPTLHLTFAASL
jgi:hypothetical protein